MAKHWVFPITLDNLSLCIKHGLIGMSGNNKLRVKNIYKDDLIVFYVSKEHYNTNVNPTKEFHSVAQCKGMPFIDNKKIWNGNLIFETRLPIKVINQKKCKIEPLIDKLSFIKNKKNWGSAFFSGARQIPPEDFFVIMKAMK
jgi:predicted RNA-binding protein